MEASALTAVEVTDSHWQSIDGALKESDFWSRWETIVKQMIEAGTPDQSFQEFIEEKYGAENQQKIKRLALDYVEGFNTASASHISVATLGAMEGVASAVSAAAVFRILNGYDRLADWLLAGCDPQRVMLRLGVIANEIKWSRGGVEVSVRPRAGQSLGHFRAWRAVITLPLGAASAAGRAGRRALQARIEGNTGGRWQASDGICDENRTSLPRAVLVKGALPGSTRRQGPAALGFLHSFDEYFPTW